MSRVECIILAAAAAAAAAVVVVVVVVVMVVTVIILQVVLLILQGKGVRKTYWLVGKDGFEKPLPVPPEQSG